MKKVTVELRDGMLYDVNGIYLVTPVAGTVYYEAESVVLELIKQKVTVNEIIDLKNAGLI